MRRKLFLDLDGVLADFDSAAEAILKTDDIHKWQFVYGEDEFWKRMNAVPGLFAKFEPMDDARHFWEKVKHLEPKILTAVPKTNPTTVAMQKRQWVRKHLGADVDVITCGSRDKPEFCEPGAILVDDRAINRAEWEAKGGVLILHTCAGATLSALKVMGVIE